MLKIIYKLALTIIRWFLLEFSKILCVFYIVKKNSLSRKLKLNLVFFLLNRTFARTLYIIYLNDR
jgi:hypothetical protein